MGCASEFTADDSAAGTAGQSGSGAEGGTAGSAGGSGGAGGSSGNAPGCVTMDLLVNGGFDDGVGPWTEQSAQALPLIYPWDDPALAEDGVTPQSGDFLARLGGADEEVAILSQIVEVPASATVVASGYVLIQTQETEEIVYDRAFIELDGGATVVATWSNLDAESGWQPFEFVVDTAESSGRRVTFRLRVTTDTGGSTRFYFDSLTLVAETCAS